MVQHPRVTGFDFEGELHWLSQRGLNWLAFVPRGQGPAPVDAVSEADGSGLLIFASLGPTFGSQTDFANATVSDPFDARSRELVAAFQDRLCAWAPRPFELLYPGSTPLDLRRFLEAGNVQFRSPIGIGIRPDCGPWLAVRAASWTVLTDSELSTLRRRYPPLRDEQNPCLSCEGTPCVSTCPAGAVSAPTMAPPMPAKSLERCLSQRLAEDSDCALACLSRSACPVGRDYRYPAAQLRYHYGVSLATIRRYRDV